MGRPVLEDNQPRFDGGLNTVADDASLAPNQVRRADNCRLTDYGAISKRGGTQRTSDAAFNGGATIQNGYTWSRDGTTPLFLFASNGTVYTCTDSASPFTNANTTAATGSVQAANRLSFAQFRSGAGNDVLYIADGSNTIKRLNATGPFTATGVALTGPISVICVHNERLWGTRSSSPDSVFYSALNNGDTLGITASAGGEIIVRTFGDETIVGLASVGASLLIFHRRGISRLTGYGQDDITVAPEGVTADVGTIAANSITASDNIAFFISERGLYRCNESQVAPVGTPDKPDPLLPIIRQMTSAELAAVRTVLNRGTRELWVFLPGYGVYIYHTILNAWSGPWTGAFLDPAPTALWEGLDAQGLPFIFKGDASGWVSVCEQDNLDGTSGPVFTDNTTRTAPFTGDSVAMTVQMHRMYSGDEAEAKALRFGYLLAQLNGANQSAVRWGTGTGGSSYALPADNSGTWGASGTTWGSGTWGGTGSQSYRIPMGGSGYYCDVTFVDSSNAIPILSRFKLQGFALGRR